MTTLPDRSPTVATLTLEEFKARYPFRRRVGWFAHPLVPDTRFNHANAFTSAEAYQRAKNIPLDVADQTAVLFVEDYTVWRYIQSPLLGRYLLPAPEPVEPQPWFGTES